MIFNKSRTGASILFVFLIMFACSRKNTPPKEEKGVQQAEEHSATALDTIDIPVPSPPDTVIWYSRSGCFGKCPVYSFLLLDNSQAIYSGRAYVPEIGTFLLELPDSSYNHFSSLIENARLEQYASDYPKAEAEWVVDLPTTTIVHFTDDQGKRVIRINHSPPDRLKAFVQELNDLIEAIDWMGF